MNNFQALEVEIDAAIQASIELLECIDQNDWEAAKKANQKRMVLVRFLSKCQKNILIKQEVEQKINKIKNLNDKIVKQGKGKHSQMLSTMCDNHYKIKGCMHYTQHR